MEKNAAIGPYTPSVATPKCCGGKCGTAKTAASAASAASAVAEPRCDLPGQQRLPFPESDAVADNIDGYDPARIAAEIAADGFR